MARRRKFEESSGGGLAPWIATYGDMMTLVLCFFILLFAMSSTDTQKFKAAMSSFQGNIDIMPGGESLTGSELITNGVNQLADIEILLQDMGKSTQDSDMEEENPSSESSSFNYESQTEKIAREIKDYLEEEGIDAKILIYYNSNYVKMTIEGEVLFDIGKANVKPEAEIIIDSMAKMILEKGYDQYKIQIDGHTDDWDIHTVQFPSNWYLSSARAIAVGDVLINKYDFDPDMIGCTGYGEYNPIDDNSTVEGRARNRRVEIKLIVESEERIPDDILLN